MASIVYVKGSNGTVYAYENISFWNKEKKKPDQKRKCIGHVDPESGEIVPNRKKGDAAKKLAVAHGSDGIPKCSVVGIGTFLLLDRIASDTGLIKTLQKVFCEDWSRILTCAYYLVSEGGALCHVDKWASANKTPFPGKLASQRVSELLLRITPSLQHDFFTRWISANRQDEYYAMDITSVSSYSEFIEFVRWGYNRDGEDLPQINLLMVTGEKSRLPIYYRIIPGSIKDVGTLRESLGIMELLNTKSMHLVMDKGFYSEKNIDALYASHMKFTIGIPFTAGYAREQVDAVRDRIFSHENFCLVMDSEVYAMTVPMKWDGHRYYVHIYYDSLKAELDARRFDHLLLVCHDELISGNRIREHEKYYSEFFIVKETPVRGIKVSYNEEAINKHKRNYVGWFVMASNDVRDKVKALEIYRCKDAVEKDFDDLKNDLDMKRLRIHSTAAMDGRIFIQYIALIISTKLKMVMSENGWFKSHDLQEVLDEMSTLREVSVEGNRRKLLTNPTNFQKQIADLYGISI